APLVVPNAFRKPGRPRRQVEEPEVVRPERAPRKRRPRGPAAAEPRRRSVDLELGLRPERTVEDEVVPEREPLRAELRDERARVDLAMLRARQEPARAGFAKEVRDLGASGPGTDPG